MFHVPNRYRVRQGPYGSDDSIGNYGCFSKLSDFGQTLFIMASEGQGWEHVSVSLPNRCPNWKEMCQVKDLFWDAEDAVMQLHPPASEYVNHHPNCLHLWRPIGVTIPLPPSQLVGPKA